MLNEFPHGRINISRAISDLYSRVRWVFVPRGNAFSHDIGVFNLAIRNFPEWQNKKPIVSVTKFGSLSEEDSDADSYENAV